MKRKPISVNLTEFLDGHGISTWAVQLNMPKEGVVQEDDGSYTLTFTPNGAEDAAERLAQAGREASRMR